MYCFRQATAELRSAAVHANLDIGGDQDIVDATDLHRQCSVTKATACLLHFWGSDKPADVIRTGTVAELRDLRAKCAAKEEALLHPALLKHTKTVLTKKA